MARGGRLRHGRALAVGLALLGGVVAALVARAAVAAGTGSCSGGPETGPGGGVDAVCLHLVRVLGLRMGITVGVTTVIVVLTVIGLSRMPASLQVTRDRSS